jgi:hypothetical protein
MFRSFRTRIGLAAILAATIFAAGNSPSYASDRHCIEYGNRTDAGSVGVHVLNNCDYPVTFVVFGDGMDYLNLNPHQSFNWTTGRFSSWTACWGKSRTNCH